MRILYLHPKAWIGEYAMLEELCARDYEVCALEEKRELEQGARADDRESHGGQPRTRLLNAS